MLTPDYITSYKFIQAGKNGYLATDVKAFCNRVYESYDSLLKEKAGLEKEKAGLESKLDAVTRMANEYKRSKNTIANAILLAQSVAEKAEEDAKKLADNIVAEARENAEAINNEKIAQADSYYNSKIAEADGKVKKAEAEFANLKKHAEVFSEKYIEDVNSRARKIIEEANATAAGIIADADAYSKKASEKADQILKDANNELNALKVQSAKIKNEILSLITLAQKAAEEVNNGIFEPIISESAEEEIVEVETFELENLEPFSLENIENVEIEEEQDYAEPVDFTEDVVSLAQEEPVFIKNFETKLPSAQEMVSDIFASFREQKAAAMPTQYQVGKEEENMYNFDIFSDPDRIDSTRRFNPINDGE